jgi:3',5'-cyclic AMP phosphodiesterase CpdA
MTRIPGKVRIAAVADLRFGRAGPPLRTLFAEAIERSDVLALCGDLTDNGEPEEARALARALAGASIPTVAVLGNHEFH